MEDRAKPDDRAERLVAVAVDHDRCVGIGRCEELQPDVVELGEDGWSYPRPGATLRLADAEQLCRECPSQAISVVGQEPS